MSNEHKPVKLVFFLICLAFLLMLASVFCNFLVNRNNKNPSDFVAGFVTLLKGSSREHYDKTLLNYFEPDTTWQFGEHFGTANQPEIIGASGMLVDINSGKVLFEKNAFEKRKIASLTKVMTAVVALEHKKPEDKFYISAKAAGIGENSMGISEGEVYTLEELLYGLVMHSGNDAAYAIAEGTAGDADRFVEWMNIKAEELGMNDTYYADPSGLDDRTYSTPSDLIRLTRYALKNPLFKEIVKTYEYEISGNTHKYLYLQNQTNLLTTYPGVAGVKTGYTEEAGLCLITYASNEGKDVVGVVLNSIDRKGDMILMLDHGFASLGVNVVHHLLDY